ncbi:MAG: 6-carboxytetrahydropterin synthase QueD [Candidatus Eisenbacteria bacterium]
MKVTLSKEFRFESAHFLPRVPEGHRCGRMHGHSFAVEISVRGEVDPQTGWLIDYGEMKRRVGPVIEQLDHRVLNEIPGLENPTSEVLAGWLWERIAPVLPELYRVTVLETCTTRCEYEGPGGR